MRRHDHRAAGAAGLPHPVCARGRRVHGNPGARRDRPHRRRRPVAPGPVQHRAGHRGRDGGRDPRRQRRLSHRTTGGRRLLERPGFLETHRRAVLDKGEPFFAKHGPKAVFFGRWIAGLRIAAAWLAGINKMPWPVFLYWNALGGIAWALSVGLLAYYLGPTAERVFRAAGLAGIVAAVLLLAAFLVWRRLRR
ncbi:MAG TPA: DedA family protein [Solirubrobacteraceae bacterium]|nr:DedA family protein [Solirubrobacteraceae bacterium]